MVNRTAIRIHPDFEKLVREVGREMLEAEHTFNIPEATREIAGAFNESDAFQALKRRLRTK